MTTCERISPQLVAYSDGELSPAESAAVQEHLATCPACRAELARLERSLQAAQRVWAEATAPPSGVAREHRYSGTVRAALALAAGIAILATVAVGWRAFRSRSIQPEVARASVAASEAELKESISRAGRAARLRASLEILANQPGMERYYAEAKQYFERTFGPQAEAPPHDRLVN